LLRLSLGWTIGTDARSEGDNHYDLENRFEHAARSRISGLFLAS
jgi:hypothetical protein